MTNGWGGLRRTAAVMSVLALAPSFVGAGCGDDADGGEGRGARAEIEATIRDTWKRFAAAADDPAAAKSYCAKLTPANQKAQVAVFFGEAKTCPQAVKAASRAWHGRGYGDLPVEFLAVSVEGREAFVKTTGGVVGHGTYRLRLVDDGGEWKLPVDALEPLSD